MTDEKWQQLIDTAQKNFDEVSVQTEDLFIETGEGEVVAGNQDILEFTNARGHFRVVRENKPVLLEKKMHFSHRQTDAARTEYVFSDSEKSQKIIFYKEDLDGEWQKIDPSMLGL